MQGPTHFMRASTAEAVHNVAEAQRTELVHTAQRPHQRKSEIEKQPTLIMCSHTTRRATANRNPSQESHHPSIPAGPPTTAMAAAPPPLQLSLLDIPSGLRRESALSLGSALAGGGGPARPMTSAGNGLGLPRAPSVTSLPDGDSDDAGSSVSGGAVAAPPRHELKHWNYPYKSWAASEGLALPVVVTKVSAGNSHTLVLTATGEAWSFGAGQRWVAHPATRCLALQLLSLASQHFRLRASWLGKLAFERLRWVDKLSFLLGSGWVHCVCAVQGATGSRDHPGGMPQSNICAGPVWSRGKKERTTLLCTKVRL
jgi:hypothetical protein